MPEDSPARRAGSSPSPGPKANTTGTGTTTSTTRAGTASSTKPGVARASSVRSSAPMSARSAAKRPTSVAGKDANGTDDSRAETAALLDELKAQLRKAESASDDYQKQLYVLQSRLDDALGEQAKLEDGSHESLERIEALQKDNQDAARRHRELEALYENDKVASMREREDAANREDELNGIVHRLKASLADREHRKSMDGEGILSRATSFRGRSSQGTGTDVSHVRDSSTNSAKLILQKDKVIESLRLELAEAQIKNVELENAGGGHMQELEKMLLEARMSNAKLMEDNESYQVLLSEKTLNGDFAKGGIFDATPSSIERAAPATPSHAPPANSNLADELEGAADADTEYVRKVEADLTAAKDQNKALTLYINKIITRLLQSETFETLFENGSLANENPITPVDPTHPKPHPTNTTTTTSTTTTDGPTNKDKDLPPAPAPTNAENEAPSLLQRAGSLFGTRQRPRPKSFNPVTTHASDSRPSLSPSDPSHPGMTLGHRATASHLAAPTPYAHGNEDPATAPSLPLRRSNSNRGAPLALKRSHRRATSDMSASIVNTMYRGPPINPSSGGLASPRQPAGPFFSTATPPLILEDAERPDDIDARAPSLPDADASDSGYGDSVVTSQPGSVTEGPPSPRAAERERSAAAAALEGHAPVVQPTSSSNPSSRAGSVAPSGSATRFSAAASGPPGKGGMRPLRLVQEKAEAEQAALEAAKKANRGSIMGWFKGAAPGAGAAPGTAPVPGTPTAQGVGALGMGMQGSPTPGGGLSRGSSYDGRPGSVEGAG